VPSWFAGQRFANMLAEFRLRYPESWSMSRSKTGSSIS